MGKEFNTKRLDTGWLKTGEKDMYDNDVYIGDTVRFISNVDGEEYTGVVQLWKGFLIAYNNEFPNNTNDFEFEINTKTLRIIETNLIKRKLNKLTK